MVTAMFVHEWGRPKARPMQLGSRHNEGASKQLHQRPQIHHQPLHVRTQLRASDNLPTCGANPPLPRNMRHSLLNQKDPNTLRSLATPHTMLSRKPLPMAADAGRRRDDASTWECSTARQRRMPVLLRVLCKTYGAHGRYWMQQQTRAGCKRQGRGVQLLVLLRKPHPSRARNALSTCH